MSRPRSDRWAPPPPWWPDRSRSRRGSRSFPASCRRAIGLGKMRSVTRSPWDGVIRFLPVTQNADANSKFARDAWIRALARTAAIEQERITLAALIDRRAAERGDAPALESREAALS